MAPREPKTPLVQRAEGEEVPGPELSGPIEVRGEAAAVHADEYGATAADEAVRELVAAATRAGLIVFRFSASRGLTFLRGPTTDFLGYSAEELFNDPTLANRVVHPEFREAIGLLGVHLHEIGSDPLNLEIPFLNRAGATVFMEVFVAPLYSPQGRIESFAGVAIETPGAPSTREEADALVRKLAARHGRA